MKQKKYFWKINKMKFIKYILNEIFASLTSFGSPIFYILIVLFLYRFDARLAIIIFFAEIFIELLCAGIKIIFKKERPIKQEINTWFDIIDANSFPSIHSARISTLAMFAILYFNDFIIGLISLFLMLGVGYSRIYLKRHYLFDVLGGFIIGALLAYPFYYFLY